MHLHRNLRIGLSISLLGVSALTGRSGFSPTPAEAQTVPAGGVLPPAPNVLLLIDRSGSMSRTVAGNVPNCTAGTDSTTLAMPAGDTINMDRYGQILEGLTGHVRPFYSCDTIDRASTRFKDEYSINGLPPPDLNYIIPYNRPLSGPNAANACAVTPGFLPGATGIGLGVIKGDTSAPNNQFANGWDPNTNDPTYVGASKGNIVDRYWKNAFNIGATVYGSTNPATCTFDQFNDGQLDIARKFIRFSLMTSDSEPNKTNGTDYGLVGGNIPWSNLTTGAGTSVNISKPFDGQWSYRPQVRKYPVGPGLPRARLPSCGSDTNFAVGARHLSAPPWEGRHVPFPPVDGPDDANLEEIQRVLLASRPYGGSPLDGMMFDAADYLWRNDDYGPWAPIGKSSQDDFVQAGCRKQYVVLISDGASNLDLRPQCRGGGAADPKCPFPTPVQTAQTLYEAAAYGGYPGPIPASNGKVKTFVIGFGAKGNATPVVAEPAWWTWPTCSAAVAAQTTALLLNNNICTPNRGTPPASLYPPGSIAEACCSLNDIAIAGDGGLSGNAAPQGAFFVESEAEFSLAMGRILGTISATTTSRATPTFSGTFTSRDTPYAGGNANASFLTTLKPQPGGLWTSDVSRRRNVCNGGTPNNLASINVNDDQFENATKAAGQRFVIVPVPVPNGAAFDPTVTFRPYDTADTDLVSRTGTAYATGKEVLIPAASAGAVAPTKLKADLFNVTAASCGSINLGSVTPPVHLAALGTADACANAIFGYAAAYSGPALGAYNIRCNSGDPYLLGCHPIGGIFHSQPVVAPPPSAFVSDDGYRAFAKTYAGRPAVLYVETMDGLLHGFDATNDTLGGPYGNELFSLIPPAVVPTLAANFPTGAATLLDSSPVVKDVVWNRARGEVGANAANRWHTMLVAGEPGGYFAMEVSDPVVDVIAAGPKEPGVGATYGPYKPSLDTGSATANTYQPGPQTIGNSPQTDFESGGTGLAIGARPVGPHFMWQLTTADEFLPETLASSGTSQASGVKQYPLFGATVGKPAITTLYFQDTAVSPLREVGVAILPGGLPAALPGAGPCLRKGGAVPVVLSDSVPNAYVVRSRVRNWNDGCTPGAVGAGAVPGRSVSIVRLDTGEIIRVFGRKVGANAQDLPHTLTGVANRIVSTPLDSPMTGTPIPYPNEVGAVAQRFYIGDADGIVWRFDVSDPDPDNWNGRVFYDTQNNTVNANAAANSSLDGQPIQVDPVVTQDQQGRAVVIIATGDQDKLIQPKINPGNAVPPVNYIVSITDRPDATATTSGYANGYVNWVYNFPAHPGERVTGPVSVFNNAVYFASYYPPAELVPTACTTGAATIHGFDYTAYPAAELPGFPATPVDNAGLTVNYVPGVAVQAGLQCATAVVGGGSSSFGTYNSVTFSSTAAATFTLSAMSATGSAIGGVGGANQLPPIKVPRVASIDSWAAVVE